MKKSQLIKIIKEEVAEVLQKITEQEDPRLEKLNKLIPDRLNKISLAVGDVERALNAIERISKDKSFRYNEDQMYRLLANMYNARGPLGAAAFTDELSKRYAEHDKNKPPESQLDIKGNVAYLPINPLDSYSTEAKKQEDRDKIKKIEDLGNWKYIQPVLRTGGYFAKFTKVQKNIATTP